MIGVYVNIEDLLLKHKSAILGKWFNCILESYPSEVSRFFKKEVDRFQNPVAYQVARGIEGVYDSLVEGDGREKIQSFLDEIIRIWAVQEVPASKALSFFVLLKRLIREELEKEGLVDAIASDVVRFESKLDELTLISFDVYMKYREKLFELKVNDVKNRVSGLLRMSGLATELEEKNFIENDGEMTTCEVQANEF